jgi:hypothetical protein
MDVSGQLLTPVTTLLQEKGPQYKQDWMADLDVMMKRKISTPSMNQTTVMQPVVNHFT